MRWLERERRTARLIRTVYDTYRPKGDVPPADLLYALCKLTWITVRRGVTSDDSTRAVAGPAFSIILGVELTSGSTRELVEQLRDHGVAEEIVALASQPIGITNYYAAYRNHARAWMAKNARPVWRIVQAIATASSDHVVSDAYAGLGSLAGVPRHGASAGHPANLLTPLLACLDPRRRAPIINGYTKELLRLLHLASASTAAQHDHLVGLIGQAGIDDAFALDVASADEGLRAKLATPRRAPRPGRGKPLASRNDGDVAVLRAAATTEMRRRHHKMTNALLDIGKRASLKIDEGNDKASLFDALIRDYQGSGRHLLVELKTDASMSTCRLAVGQLLDYRRMHQERAAVDLAVLFPEVPSQTARDFLGYVGVKVLWFDKSMRAILGDVALPRSWSPRTHTRAKMLPSG